MQKELKTTREVLKVSGVLREIVTVKDTAGNIIHKVMNPLRVEFRAKDILQIMVGAILLAIPVGFTEEVWNLGATLPLPNILFFFVISILMISVFIYYSYYRDTMKQHKWEFLKRVLSTYIFSFITVAMFLSAIEATPWGIDFMLSLKRTILVTFPASMSAAVVDTLK